jgi:hypothetical protein
MVGGMYSQVNTTRIMGIMDETERDRAERIRERGDTLRIYLNLIRIQARDCNDQTLNTIYIYIPKE